MWLYLMLSLGTILLGLLCVAFAVTLGSPRTVIDKATANGRGDVGASHSTHAVSREVVPSSIEKVAGGVLVGIGLLAFFGGIGGTATSVLGLAGVAFATDRDNRSEVVAKPAIKEPPTPAEDTTPAAPVELSAVPPVPAPAKQPVATPMPESKPTPAPQKKDDATPKPVAKADDPPKPPPDKPTAPPTKESTPPVSDTAVKPAEKTEVVTKEKEKNEPVAKKPDTIDAEVKKDDGPPPYTAVDAWRKGETLQGKRVVIKGLATVKKSSIRYVVVFLDSRDRRIIFCSVEEDKAAPVKKEDLSVSAQWLITLEGVVKSSGGGTVSVTEGEIQKIELPPSK